MQKCQEQLRDQNSARQSSLDLSVVQVMEQQLGKLSSIIRGKEAELAELQATFTQVCNERQHFRQQLVAVQDAAATASTAAAAASEAEAGGGSSAGQKATRKPPPSSRTGQQSFGGGAGKQTSRPQATRP